MRLTIHLLGVEVFRICADSDKQPTSEYEHDHVAAQVELAAEVPIGFVIPQNPSVT